MEEYLAFSLYDANGDGYITLPEMTAYLESLYTMINKSSGGAEPEALPE